MHVSSVITTHGIENCWFYSAVLLHIVAVDSLIGGNPTKEIPLRKSHYSLLVRLGSIHRHIITSYSYYMPMVLSQSFKNPRSLNYTNIHVQKFLNNKKLSIIKDLEQLFSAHQPPCSFKANFLQTMSQESGLVLHRTTEVVVSPVVDT